MTDTTDLVARLRSYAKDQGGWHNIDDTCEQAADTIERLTRERDEARALVALKIEHCPPDTRLAKAEGRLAKLEAALKPFAEAADEHGGGYADYDSAFVAVKWLRAARAALEAKP